MRDILLAALMIAVAVWGYYLMGRLDHFLNTHVSNEESDGK